MAEWLYAEPYRFEFFQAVRLLEGLAEPGQEAVRLASKLRWDFAASDLESLTPGAAGEPPRLVVNFLGVAGSEGPLPAPLAEIVQDRIRERDFGPRDFLDIFHHRLLELLYRAAQAHRPALTPSTPEQSAAGEYLRAFAGLAPAGLRHRQAVPDAALLYYAGLLCQRPRSASGLERMLADYFQIPVRVRQMRGRWRALPEEETTALGVSGRNQRLGAGAALGGRMWDQAGGIELELGPLTQSQFAELLPGGAAARRLRDLTCFYAGTALALEARLVLRAAEVPAARLGQARLGWTGWLQAHPRTADAAVHIGLETQGLEN